MTERRYLTKLDVDEWSKNMTNEKALSFLTRAGVLPDSTKINYTICAVTYDWFTMCKEWEEEPKHWDGGQFCGGIETYTYTHPILPERDITFTFDGDTMIDCYSVLRK